MNLQEICRILKQRVALQPYQSFSYFNVQNGGEYIWFNDSDIVNPRIYFEITYFDPNFIVAVGPRSGDKVSTIHRDIDSLIIKCQELVDSINR